MKCYRIDAEGAAPHPGQGNLVSSNGAKYPIWRRFNSLSWRIDTIRSSEFGGGYTGCLAYYATYDGVDSRDGSARPVSPVLDESNPNCPAVKYYDCINGQCTEKTQYNTPGLYQSLEECQVNCGTTNNNECPPGYVCLTTSEFSEISSLASQIKGAVCG